MYLSDLRTRIISSFALGIHENQQQDSLQKGKWKEGIIFDRREEFQSVFLPLIA